MDAARAAKCTLDVERKLAEVKGYLLEVTHQLKYRGQGLNERAERAEEALLAKRVYSRQGRTVLYV